MEKARQYAGLTDEQRKKADDLANAQKDLSLAVSGFTDTLGSELSPVLTPLLEDLAKWIVSLKDNKEFMDQLRGAVRGFGDAIKGINWHEVWEAIKGIAKGVNDAVQAFGGWERAGETLGVVLMLKVLSPLTSIVATLGNLVAIRLPLWLLSLLGVSGGTGAAITAGAIAGYKGATKSGEEIAHEGAEHGATPAMTDQFGNAIGYYDKEGHYRTGHEDEDKGPGLIRRGLNWWYRQEGTRRGRSAGTNSRTWRARHASSGASARRAGRASTGALARRAKHPGLGTRARSARAPAPANDQSAGVNMGAAKPILDELGKTEGTDRRRGYNETLGYGALTGDVDLQNMTLAEVDALQTKMLQDPKNKLNSSAVGRYQIVQKTMREAPRPAASRSEQDEIFAGNSGSDGRRIAAPARAGQVSLRRKCRRRTFSAASRKSGHRSRTPTPGFRITASTPARATRRCTGSWRKPRARPSTSPAAPAARTPSRPMARKPCAARPT